MKRIFTKRQKRILAFVSGGKCVACGKFLQSGFHADHVIPFSKGGRTVTNNGQALCPECNLAKGAKV
ncbi:MAG: HNH endonuclease [Gammaproteobacteria bacterium]|nr:MAG: HNH endonuclease [Gammaproteobacteria bacterium]